MMLRAVYENLCPICGGPISSERLSRGLPCENCLEGASSGKDISTLYGFKRASSIVEELNSYFLKILGAKMWSAQRMWAKRILSGQSFSMIAPTGSGKTVFGIIMSLFFSTQHKRTLFILPTSILVEQVYSKALDFARKLGLDVEIAAYHSFMTPKEKKASLEAIARGEYDILIVTSNFISRRFDHITKRRFDLVFVDDVDSILKSSKIFDKVLLLLGFEERHIQVGLKLVELRARIGRALRRGDGESVAKINKEIEELRRELDSKKSNIGILVVSGASLRGRHSKRVKLFMELLDFDVGSRVEAVRNIIDTYMNLDSRSLEAELLNLVKVLGRGGIVFVPQDRGLSLVKRLSYFLAENGVKVEAYIRPRRGMLQRFASGEVEVLVGIASSRSPLSRGIDLPETVKYAIFAGVPKVDFVLDPSRLSPAKKIILLANILDFLGKREKNLCRVLISSLRKILPVASLMYRGAEIEVDPKFKNFIERVLNDADSFIRAKMNNKRFLGRLQKSPYIEVEGSGRIVKLVVSDPIGYIQASGRTSRLYAGGVSKGLSIVLIDNEKAFKHLQREVSRKISDIEFVDISRVDLASIAEELERERRTIKEIIAGKRVAREKGDVKVSLFVVESPNKARTISWFFGRPSSRRVGRLRVYEVHTGKHILLVTSTGGHLFDLVTGKGIYGISLSGNSVIPFYSTIKRCFRCGEAFTDDLDACPKCGSEEYRDSMETVRALRKLALDVDRVLIGTDPDAEGEKIAWDIYLALRPYIGDIKRVEFHEVTPSAILKALDNPREINMKLVESQIARRIEDRWIGFGLSSIVQKNFGIKVLSAGRVQTPVLGWIIGNYDSYKNHKVFLLIMELEGGIRVAMPLDVKNGWEARRKVKELADKRAVIRILEEKVKEITPYPPYTTDSLLKDSSQILKLSAEHTMRLAQNLFEAGLITYHRTDSVRVSPAGIALARKYIVEKYGQGYYQGRSWSGDQEGAHECIRPTRPIDAEELSSLVMTGMLKIPIRLTQQHLMLYNLIFRRFIASQMRGAKVKRSTVRVEVDGMGREVEFTSEILDEGFTKLIRIRAIPVVEGERPITSISYRKVSKVKLLNQGDVVALMKERGLGRPSTYSKIIDTLLKRRYVISVGRGGFLIPMKLGREVYFYLVDRFPDIVSEDKTRKLLREMDLISEGKLEYSKVLTELYQELTTLNILEHKQ